MVLTMERPLARVLTADEWDALPDTSGLELIDGMVHVTPAPTPRHEYVKSELRNILKRRAPGGLAVTTEIEVRISADHCRRPDVLVALRPGFDLDKWLLRAEQVVVAVEVVSPGSETTDRKHKPVEYADAGIAHYWRVETRPVVAIHTYRLGDGGQYIETGAFHEGDQVADPTLRWATFDVNELLP